MENNTITSVKCAKELANFRSNYLEARDTVNRFNEVIATLATKAANITSEEEAKSFLNGIPNQGEFEYLFKITFRVGFDSSSSIENVLGLLNYLHKRAAEFVEVANSYEADYFAAVASKEEIKSPQTEYEEFLEAYRAPQD